MIVEAIADALYGLFNAVLSLLAPMLPDPPAFWVDGADALDSLLGEVSAPLRWFLPIAPLLQGGLALMLLLVTLGVLQLVRRAVSLFTGGGGSL